MIKDLRDWKKESERKNRNKHQWGWFQHPNAGNVEYTLGKVAVPGVKGQPFHYLGDKGAAGQGGNLPHHQDEDGDGKGGDSRNHLAHRQAGNKHADGDHGGPIEQGAQIVAEDLAPAGLAEQGDGHAGKQGTGHGNGIHDKPCAHSDSRACDIHQPAAHRNQEVICDDKRQGRQGEPDLPEGRKDTCTHSALHIPLRRRVPSYHHTLRTEPHAQAW